jgi:hypothetical protein
VQNFKILDNGYTENEMNLFYALQMDHLVKNYSSPNYLYKAFLTRAEDIGLMGPAVEALKRANTAFDNNYPKRFTNEFEKLIRF